MSRDALTLSRAVDLWHGHLRSRMLADSTVSSYVRSVEMIVAAVGRHADPQTLTIEDLEAVIASWRRVRPNTTRNRLVAWREFLAWGRDRYDWPDLATKLDLPRRDKPALRRLSADEVDAMLAADVDERRLTVVWILAYTGIRRGELLALRWRDVDLVHASLRIDHRTAKGRKGRVIPLHADLVARLALAKDARGAGAADRCYVLPHRRRAQFIPEDERIVWNEPSSGQTIDRIVKQTAEAAGVRYAEEITSHAFRRFILEELLEAGTSPYVAAALAGHASIQTTAEYGGGASMRAVADALHAHVARDIPRAERPTTYGRTWDRTKAPSQQPDERDEPGPTRPLVTPEDAS